MFKILVILWVVGAGVATRADTAPAKSKGHSSSTNLVIATASNFKSTAEELIREFQSQLPGDSISISAASTGQLIAQIEAGAPFDILFSADEQSCNHLLKAKLIGAEQTRIYAIGRLVLATNHAQSPEQILVELKNGNFDRIAIPNPKLAPYGRAAMETLKFLSVASKNTAKTVWAQNVGQSRQFLDTGAVTLAFLAKSQTVPGDHFVEIAPESHQPIRQCAAIMKKSAEKSIVQRFWEFSKSTSAAKILETAGYLAGPKQGSPR